MRRSTSGRSAGLTGRLGRESRGSGRASLTGRSVVVDDEGGDRIGDQELAAPQEAQLYEEGDAGHDTAGVLDEPAHRASGAAGCEKVVDHEDAGAFGYGVGVDLERVLTILEVVGGGDRLSGKLIRFAGEDEAFAGTVGQSRPEDEAAGLRREYAGVVDPFGGASHPVDGGVEGGTVLYEGGYVFEGDAGFGEVGDLPNVARYLL